MNIQKTFLILSLCFISQTFRGHEAPTTSRDEELRQLYEQYHRGKYEEHKKFQSQLTQELPPCSKDR